MLVGRGRMPKDQVTVKSKCRQCGRVDEFQVPKGSARSGSGLDAAKRGRPLHVALAGIPPERLVQLQDHTCPECQALAKS